MYKCRKCGAEIKYITSVTGTKLFTVDAEKKHFITPFGREGDGYTLHVCEVKTTDDKGKTD